MAAYLQIDIHQGQLIRPRELVIVLASREDYLYLDYEKRGMNIFLHFFEEELEYMEEPDKKAQEILVNKGFIFRELHYLGSIFPHHGDYDKIYVYLAREIKSVRVDTFLSLSLSEAIDAMRSGLFLGSRCERALRLYIAFLREKK